MEDLPDEVERETAINGAEADNNGRNYRDERGRFAVGNAGRPLGAKSKSRTALNMFMDAQVENLDKWFAGLATDKERLEAFTKLCPYRFPRLSSVAVKEDPEQKAVINFSNLSEAALKEVLANTTTNE